MKPFAWMTHESKARLSDGGNCKGAVPVHGKSSATSVLPLFTASQLRQAVQEAVEAERRRCAELCEGLRDLREEARAILKASAALSEGDAAETLRRLRHESDVRLHNGALDRAAAAIRSGA
jgi:hypothetical protein